MAAMTQQKTFTMACHKCSKGLIKHIVLYEETVIVLGEEFGETHLFVRCPACSSFKYVRIDFDPYIGLCFPAMFHVFCAETCSSVEEMWADSANGVSKASCEILSDSIDDLAAGDDPAVEEVLKKFFNRHANDDTQQNTE